MKDELPDLELFLKKKGGNSQGRTEENAPGKTDISQKLSALVKKPGTSTGTNPSVPESMSSGQSSSANPVVETPESSTGIVKPPSNGNNNGQESPIGIASDKSPEFNEADSQSAWSAATSLPNAPSALNASVTEPQTSISTSITSSTTSAGANRPAQPNVKGPQAMPMSTLSSGSAPSLLKAPTKLPGGRPAQPYSYKPVIEPGRELMAPKAPSAAPTARAPQPMPPKPTSVAPASKPVAMPAPVVKQVEAASASPLHTAMPSKTPIAPPPSPPSGRVESDAEKLARAFREEAQALEHTNSMAGTASGAPHASFDDSLDAMDENLDEDLLNNSFFEDEGPVNAQNIQNESVSANSIGLPDEYAEVFEESPASANQSGSQPDFRSAFLAEEAAAAAASGFSATSPNPSESPFKSNEVHGDGPKASLSNLFDSGVLNSRYGDDAPSKPLGFGNLLAGSSHDDESDNDIEAKHTTFADLMVPTGEHDALFAPDRREVESGPSALEQITAQLAADATFKAPQAPAPTAESSPPAFGSLFGNEIVTSGNDFSHGPGDSDLLEPEEASAAPAAEPDFLSAFDSTPEFSLESSTDFNADSKFASPFAPPVSEPSFESTFESSLEPASEAFSKPFAEPFVEPFAEPAPEEIRSPKSLAISKLLEAVNQKDDTASGADSAASEAADLMFSDAPTAPTGLGNLLGGMSSAAAAEEAAPVRSAFDLRDPEDSEPAQTVSELVLPVEGDVNSDGLSAKALEALAAFAPTIGEEQHETKGLLKKLKARDAAEKAALKAGGAKAKDDTTSGEALLAKKAQDAKELKDATEAKQLKEAQELQAAEEAKLLAEQKEVEARKAAEREAAEKWAAEEEASAAHARQEDADAGSLASLLAAVTPSEEIKARTPVAPTIVEEVVKEEEEEEEEDEGNSLGDAISDALDKLLSDAGGEKDDEANIVAADDVAAKAPTQAEKDKAYFDRFEQPINSKHHDLAKGEAPKAAVEPSNEASFADDDNDRFNRPINNPLRKAEEKLEEVVTAASATESPVVEAPAHPMTLTNSKVDALSRLLEVASKAPVKSNEDKNKPGDSANKLANMINKPPGKVSRQVETISAPEPQNDNFTSPFGGGTSPFASPGASYSGPGAVNSGAKPGRDAASPFGTAVNSGNSGVSLNHTPAGGFSPTGQGGNPGFNNPGGVGAASMTDMPKASGIATDAVQARIAALNRALDEQSRGPGANSSTASSAVPGPSLAPPVEVTPPPPLISNPAPDFVPNPIVDGSAQTRAELMNRILGSAKISQTAMPDGASRQEMSGEQTLAQLQAQKNQKNSQKSAQASQKNSPPKSKARAHGGGGLNPKSIMIVLVGLVVIVAAGYFAVQKGVINLKAMDIKGFDMGKGKGADAKQSIDQMIKSGDTDKAIEALEDKKESGKFSNSESEKLSGLYYSTAEKAYNNDEDPAEAIKQLEKIPSKSKKYKDAQRLMRKLKKKVKKG